METPQDKMDLVFGDRFGLANDLDDSGVGAAGDDDQARGDRSTSDCSLIPPSSSPVVKMPGKISLAWLTSSSVAPDTGFLL
jgi:hypothetical protein